MLISTLQQTQAQEILASAARLARAAVISISLVLMSLGCAAQTDHGDTRSLPLKDLADFPIGIAVPADPWPNTLLGSPERQALVNRHFDSLTAENIMKMAYLQPQEGRFEFRHADALMKYADKHDMVVHGHALVWHTQAPQWMNDYSGTREEFLTLLTAHVKTVAEHFAGRMESWDVVNEAFRDEVPVEYRDTIWYSNIGPEYIEHAFRVAHAADPQADLYYNDYDISGAIGPEKLDRILQMVDDFIARGVPIHGIGFQVHIDTETPNARLIREAFSKAVQRGVKVRISELDISVNPNKTFDEFSEDLARIQRQRYEEVVGIYLDTVPPQQRGGITVWGITDGDSWIPGFRKRADWPLLFNDAFEEKPALTGFADALQAGQ